MDEASGDGVEHEVDAAAEAPLTSRSTSTRARLRTVVGIVARIAISAAVMAAYFAGISLGLDHPKDRVLFQLPATLLLVLWLYVVLVHDHRPRTGGAGGATRGDRWMLPASSFRWRLALFSVLAAGCIVSVFEPSWSPLLSTIGVGVVLAWSLVAFVVSVRRSRGTPPPAAE